MTMNGLKKFQEFALSADEQKSLTGGLLADGSWSCVIESGGVWYVSDVGSEANAVAKCQRAGSRCVGCYN